MCGLRRLTGEVGVQTLISLTPSFEEEEWNVKQRVIIRRNC